MTLEQLGKEYLKQADDLKRMIEGYSVLKKGAKGIELYDINNRIVVLSEMERDTRITGKQLVEYYSNISTKKVYRSHRFN